MKISIDEVAERIHSIAQKKGFYPIDVNKLTSDRVMNIALIIGELSEAIEGLRENNIVGPPGTGSYREELIDALMRLLDLLAMEKVNIEVEINNKLVYNKSRGDKHGKLF